MREQRNYMKRDQRGRPRKNRVLTIALQTHNRHKFYLFREYAGGMVMMNEVILHDIDDVSVEDRLEYALKCDTYYRAWSPCGRKWAERILSETVNKFKFKTKSEWRM